MASRRTKLTGNANPLERLRVRGTGPDPGFRAVLRERLVAEASGASEDNRNSARKEGRAKPVD